MIFLHQVEKEAELMKKSQILEFHMRFFLQVLERCQRLELYDVLYYTALNCPLGSLPGEGRHSLIWPKGVCAAEHGMGTAKN